MAAVARNFRQRGLGLIVAGLALITPVYAAEDLVVRMRQPVALATVDEGRRLVTANHRSGSLSVVDLVQRRVEFESAVGEQLSDLVVLPNSTRLLVTDELSHELIAVRLSADAVQVEKRLAVSGSPVAVRVNREGTRAYVASLWSRTISVVDLTSWLSDGEKSNASCVEQIRLPFAPRLMVVIGPAELQRLSDPARVSGERLIVADAFGGKIALIDPGQVGGQGQVLAVREILGHAIRGMQLHPTRPTVVTTHQLLSRIASSTQDDIHWGGLMHNCLHTLDLRDLLDPQAELMRRSAIEYIGGPDRGSGDPAGFFMQPEGAIGVAISGTDEFLMDRGNGRLFATRLKTEGYPTVVACRPDFSEAYVANTFSDSITVIAVPKMQVLSTISLGPRPEPTAADRGERLFHDSRLSHERWISCASCHVEGHTNGLLNDNFTDHTFGTAKRVLTLRGVAETAPYAWNGRFATLADQIRNSVESTMQGSPLTDAQVGDLEAYVKTLTRAPALEPEGQATVTAGAAVFERLDCRRCHAPPTYTSAKVVDVDLSDEEGDKEFNPPSLRGVVQNGPYFHDGRAKRLEDVFLQFRHQLDRELSKEELRNLVAFLKSL